MRTTAVHVGNMQPLRKNGRGEACFRNTEHHPARREAARRDVRKSSAHVRVPLPLVREDPAKDALRSVREGARRSGPANPQL